MTNQKRKKVIIFITKSNWGGAQKYVFDLATHLPTDMFEVMVALGGNGLLYTRLVDAGIRVIELESLQRDISFTKDIVSFFNIVRIIKSEKPDIIHVNSTKISGLGALAGRIFGVKNIIFTVHGWAFNENRGYISKTVIKLLYLLMLWLSHSVIAVSHKIKDQVKLWPFKKEKIKVIHNGITSPKFLSKENARTQLGKIVEQTFSDETILIGGIGELHPIKGQTYAIQALEKIMRERPTLNIKYIIMGAGDIENELQQEIINRNLLGTVFLTSYLEDAAQYITALDYYLFPSLSEGLAYAAIEAGFAQLPIIASKVGGLVEVIEAEKEGILIPSKNSDAIAEALYTYIDNPERAEKYSIAFHGKAVREFSLDKMVAKTIEVYNN